jgi:beta-glucosidase
MKNKADAKKQAEAIKALVSQLTLEEKAGLCSGEDNWFTKTVERLSIPACRTSDGPHGLRTQQGGSNNLSKDASIPAVCFPPACTSAASFDRELLQKMGAALGRECQALGVNVLLGPGINIKRGPLCGRNFEYFSEDPLVAGELGAAYVMGVQGEGAGVSLKHFFANSQEHRRMDSSSEMGERTMREIYLTAFETVVKKAQPWTIMAAYNRIDGIYATANKQYLTGVLRDEWGFEGLVMSDWGATHDRVAAVEAGCDLTMPSAANTDHEIVDAVRAGTLDESVLNSACERILSLVFKGAEAHKDSAFDYEGDHVLSREAAAESIVLLKNEDHILPLGKTTKVAFIGAFAQTPRYQGGGSSNINSYKVVSPWEAAQAAALPAVYAAGYAMDNQAADETLIAEAVTVAKTVDIAVVFAGLPDDWETEGVDRHHIAMPAGHNALIEAVCAVQPNTVVVLHNGSPVEMPWAGKPKAIVEAYLSGQAVGEAVIDILYGAVNPSGHLAETFPKKLADNPSYLFYFGEGGTVSYNERMFVGYRYYESKQMDTLFPFGHGLSYTTFGFSNLTLDKAEMGEDDTLTAAVTVTNTGDRAGKALVQLYVAPEKREVIRPLRELKAFEKVELLPGESKTVSFKLAKRAFAHWDEKAHDWTVESGSYTVQICENAHTVLLEQAVHITARERLQYITYSETTIMNDFSKHPAGYKFMNENIGYMIRGMASAGYFPKEMLTSMGVGEDDTIDLSLLEKIGKMRSQASESAEGVSVMMTQPLSLLTGFLPPEKMQELKELFNTLNGSGN